MGMQGPGWAAELSGPLADTQQRDQDDRADRGHDQVSQEAGRMQAEQVEEETAQQRADDTDDEIAD